MHAHDSGQRGQTIVDSAGVVGSAIMDSPPGTLRVRLSDGAIVELDDRLIRRRRDGTPEVPGRWHELATKLSIPRVEEHVAIGKHLVDRGALVITKRVHEEDVTLHEPEVEEDFEIERVAANRFVDTPPDVRTEGDTLIIPIVEEVVVVEKRLRLREELHVRRIRREVTHPITLNVRREHVDVQHRSPNEAAGEEMRQESKNQEEESS